MENIKRVTVGELKKVLSKLPDETLISLQSDSEGNQESTLLDWFVVKIGDEHTFNTVNGQSYTYKDGDETMGVNMEKDKGKYLLVLTPSL